MRRGGDVCLAVLVGAAGLGACHPVHRQAHPGSGLLHHQPYTRVLSRLDCPDQEGRLSRLSTAPDGRSCRYADADGEQVDLDLIALSGRTVEQALQPVEADLRIALPSAGAHGASSDPQARTDRTRIDLPGLHIEADGDRAHVQLPGVSVDAAGDDAKVRAGFNGGTEVHADSRGAVVRTGDVDNRGADLTFLLASDVPGPTGVRAAGYVARGPATGPLVVASFQTSRSGHRDGDGIDRLVDMNVNP